MNRMDDAGKQAKPRRAWLSLGLGAFLSALAFWLIARSVNLDATLAALASSQLSWVLLAFILQIGATLSSVRRWQILLQPYPTHFWSLTQILFVAHLLNTLLPAKLGTVARVLLAAEEEKLNVGFVFGSVALEKVLDTLVMLVLFLALAPFAPLPEWARDALGASVLVVLLGVVVLASVSRVREPLLSVLARGEAKLFGARSQRLTAFARGMLESLANLRGRREAFSVLLWTAMIWALGIAVNYVLFLALGLVLPWSAAIFILVVLQIGTRVPALPANLGVFHYLVILALGVYRIPESDALAYAILLHLVVFILPAFLGAACALPLSARLTALVSAQWRRP